MRICLLELVDRAVRQQFEYPAPTVRTLHLREHVRRVIRRAQVEQRLGDIGAVVPGRERGVHGGLGLLAQRGLEPLLDLPPHA
jgi:hypothetical protein